MAAIRGTSYNLRMVKGGSFFRGFVFYQDEEATQEVDLTGKSPRFLVKYGGQTLEWTVAGGEVTVVAPATDGAIELSLTTTEVNALTFKAATFYLFLDNEAELVLEGTVSVE